MDNRKWKRIKAGNKAERQTDSKNNGRAKET
jgi:hypothetical protein